MEVDESYPEFKCNRTKPKEMQIVLRKDWIVCIEFGNNKVRDVLFLLSKYLLAKKQKES